MLLAIDHGNKQIKTIHCVCIRAAAKYHKALWGKYHSM